MACRSSLNISAVGKRQGRHKSDDSIVVTTARVLQKLEHDSPFFEQNPPSRLPTFTLEEVELRNQLGSGEFGVVMSVAAFHVQNECPCESCEATKVEQGTGNPMQPRQPSSSANNSQTHAVMRPHVIKGIPGTNKENQDGNEDSDDPHINVKGNSSQTNNSKTKNTHLQHLKSSGTQISLSEDIKVSESDSTVSTYSNLEDDDDMSDTFHDGEIEFLRTYMAQHCFRKGLPRYAMKQLRSDLEGTTKMEAAIDLASEAKFLASLHHPNVVKMRGSVGVPGSADFRIIMDCLTMTLREKIELWNEEEKRLKSQKGLFGFLASSAKRHGGSTADDVVFHEKLLAVFDIARAMRYLHNKLIIFRDLKPENVAFDLRGEMRLFDFGLAKELKTADLVKAPDSFRATGQTGSRRYMAPETVLCKNYGFSADVFSWAILTWEVFSGEMTFKRLSVDKHFQQVVINGKRPKRLGHLPKNITKQLEDAWHDDPSKRPRFRDICDQLGLQVNVSNSAKGESDRTSILANQSLRSRAGSWTDSPKQSRLKVFLPQQESNS